jgi:hypothetical protein
MLTLAMIHLMLHRLVHPTGSAFWHPDPQNRQ